MNITIGLALLVVCATVYALIKRYETRLVLLTAGLVMTLIAMDPMAAFKQFDKSMTTARSSSPSARRSALRASFRSRLRPPPRASPHEAARQARHLPAARLHHRGLRRRHRHSVDGRHVRRRRPDAHSASRSRGLPPGHGSRRRRVLRDGGLLQPGRLPQSVHRQARGHGSDGIRGRLRQRDPHDLRLPRRPHDGRLRRLRRLQEGRL